MELTGNVAYADIDSRESVLSSWYDAYGTDVLRLCCFYLGSRADAEDATQETFLKAWKHMDRFQYLQRCQYCTCAQSAPRTEIRQSGKNSICRTFLGQLVWRNDSGSG